MITGQVNKLFINRVRGLKGKVKKLDGAMKENERVHDNLWNDVSKALLNNVDDETYNETLQLIQDSYEATQYELETLQEGLEKQVEEIAENINSIIE